MYDHVNTKLTNISGVGVNEKSENENSDLSTKKVENELGLPSEGRSDRSDSQIDEKSTKTESERYQFESNNLSDRTLEESDILYKRIRDRRNKKFLQSQPKIQRKVFTNTIVLIQIVITATLTLPG